MSDHTAHDYHDPEMATPGHNSLIVYVHQTRQTGLHCDDCGWFAGSRVGRPGRWREKHMREAWDRHIAHAATGAVLVHGTAANVTEKVCHCVTCMIAYRQEQR